MPIEHASHDDARHRFDVVLDEIRDGIVKMGSLVTENVRRAGEAMRESRLDLVDVVRDGDLEINRMYLELEHLTFETVARQQPVATDLRFLVSATRMLYEIERSGDLAVNCVNVLERQEGFPDAPGLIAQLDALVDASARVFAQAVDAVADLDEGAGPALDAADDEVDDLVSRFYTSIGAESETIGLDCAVAFTRIGRFLERIADHAVNIGENVTYIVTAAFPGDERGDPIDQG